MLLFGVAFAAGPLTWDTLNAEALAAFEAGPGASAEARVQAAQRARRAVPLGPTALRTEAQLGFPDQRQIFAAVDIPLTLGLRERALWGSVADAHTANGDTERWAWAQGVQEAWLTWWTVSEIAEHLESYSADVDDELAGFEVAVQEGLLAPLALEDLRAESIQIRAEAGAMEQQARVAAAHVRALIGDRQLDAGDHELHDVDPSVPNPWTGLSAEVDRLPAVREAAARGEVARRQAGALVARRAPTLSVGPMWAPDANGRMTGFAYVALSLPLQPGIGPDQRAARGEQAAAEADQRWHQRSLAAHLEEEALAWEAARDRLVRLQSEVLGPLQARQERLEAALAQGLVTADRVVRARRERHEAEHEQVLVVGMLLASTARAGLVGELIGGDR